MQQLAQMAQREQQQQHHQQPSQQQVQQQFLQNLQQSQLALNANQLQHQLIALAGNNANGPFSEQLLNAATGHQLMNHQALNGRLHNELENLEDEEDCCDSDDLTYDEEEDSDFEFDESEVDGLERPDQTKSGRKLKRFRLFGQSPKLLKKFKNKSLKHQKDKRYTGHNNTTVKPGDTTDAPTAWISMGEGKMLDEDQNLVDQPKSPSEKSLNEEKDKKVFADEPADAASINSADKELLSVQKSASSEKLSATIATENSTPSLNSSQSSFVQLTTKSTPTTDQQCAGKETPKSSPKSSTSLASKWFGRKSGGDSQEKPADGKKKTLNKSAPQITQVIYKRKPDLPEKPVGSNGKEAKQEAPLPPAKPRQLKQTVSVPSDEETDLDDRIYAEINETALVLEEMKRSLDKNSTERKIIEMILQQPASLPDKLPSSIDQLKVK